MKRKVIAVAVVMWFAALLGGGIWADIERRLQARQVPAGVAELQKLKDLYSARLYDEVLTECDRAESNAQYAVYAPQIMYVRWAASRQLGRVDESNQVQKVFLERFPGNVLAADMHFATATASLAAGDYAAADRELATIQNGYPSAIVAKKVMAIRERLRTVATTTPAVR